MRRRDPPAVDQLSCGNVRILHVSASGRANNVSDAIDTYSNVDHGGLVLVIIRELSPMATLRGTRVRRGRVRARPGTKPQDAGSGSEGKLSHSISARREIVPAMHGT